MLDTITRDTTTADLLQVTIEFTEQQARAWLAEQQGARPSIRACATSWNWPKSRAERFLSRVDAETATETPKPDIERIAEIVRNACAQTAPAEKPDPFFDHDSADLFVPRQCAIAIYENPYGQVVIRAEDMGDDSDDCVIVSRPYLRAFIARLDAMARGFGL